VVVFLVEKEEEEKTIIISLVSFVEQDSSYLFWCSYTTQTTLPRRILLKTYNGEDALELVLQINLIQ
jgi:hypothetical protein